MGPDQETSFPSDSSRAVVNTNKLNPESCSTRSFISQNVLHTTSYPTTPGSPKSLWWPNDHRPEHKVLPFPTHYPCSPHPLLCWKTLLHVLPSHLPGSIYAAIPASTQAARTTVPPFLLLTHSFTVVTSLCFGLLTLHLFKEANPRYSDKDAQLPIKSSCIINHSCITLPPPDS